MAVTNGSGGGLYAEGAQVFVESEEPDQSQVFEGWTSNYNIPGFDKDSSFNAFKMPASNVNITANLNQAEPIDKVEIVLPEFKEDETLGKYSKRMKIDYDSYKILDMFWSDGDNILEDSDIFQEGEIYWLNFELEAKTGHRFHKGTNVFLNGKDLDLAFNGEGGGHIYLNKYLYFTTYLGSQSDDKWIDRVSITATHPVAGQHPDFTFKLPSGASYEIIEDHYYWYGFDEDKDLDDTDSFVLGQEYELGIHLGPKSGYYFDMDDIKSYINGKEVEVEDLDDGTIVVYYIFTASASTPEPDPDPVDPTDPIDPSPTDPVDPTNPGNTDDPKNQ